MSQSESKSQAPTRHAAAPWSGLFRVAIVGAGTLKGRELNEVVHDRKFPALDIKLLDDDESLGQIEASGDEAAFIQSVRPEHFDNIDFAFFASDAEFTRRHWRMAKDAGSTVVDLSYALEEEPGVQLRSPWVERELGLPMTPDLQPTPVIIAHPAATVLALLTLRAQKAAGVRQMAASIFEPASERGKRGMDELHEQTVNLLSFQQLPKTAYGAQVAFNLISRYGENIVPTLESVERRIAGHFRRILGDAASSVPVPSLMLMQAPVFHSYAFAVYLELEKTMAVGDFEQALAGDHFSVTHTAEDSPNNVSAAGQEDVLLSVRRDAANESGFWLWIAADNLKIAAISAVDSAESMAAARPKGRVQ